MATITQEAILALSDEDKIVLIDEYEQFERDGFIGDCKLRALARTMPNGNSMVTMWMTILAHECYRYFANKYFSLLQHTEIAGKISR